MGGAALSLNLGYEYVSYAGAGLAALGLLLVFIQMRLSATNNL